MPAGVYKHPIVIQRLKQLPTEEARDSFGGVVKEWEIYAKAMADIRPDYSREYWSAGQINSEITGEIRTPYISGVKPDMRVVYNGRKYDIFGVTTPRERRRILILHVKEAVD